MLVRKLENFRATLSDIFMGKSIGIPSQNEHFRHFHLGILSQDWKVRSRSIDTAQLSRVQRANGKLTTILHCRA